MIIGEDRNKISNIVRPNVDQFYSLYQPHVSHLLEPAASSHNNELLQLKVSITILIWLS